MAVADEYLHELNADAKFEVFGQDHNPESYAVCGSDMLIKGHNIDHIVFGSSYSKDWFEKDMFDYLLANPPFGVEWKPDHEAIEKEHETRGFDGRFGAGTPRINEGSFLFLQHMISKMKPVKDGGIDSINERFGTDFTQADELFFYQLREEAIADEELQQAASANTLDNFRYVFVKALEGLFIDRMEQNEKIFAKYMNDGDFRKTVSEYLMKQVYDQIREEDV